MAVDCNIMIDKCRSCLRCDDNMTSLYQANDCEFIYKNLMMCASVTITKNDGGPTSICSSCLTQLNDALKFKLMCEDTDRKIKAILKDSLNIECDGLFTKKNEKNKCLVDKCIKEEVDNVLDLGNECLKVESSLDINEYLLNDLEMELENKNRYDSNQEVRDTLHTTSPKKKKKCQGKILRKNKKKGTKDKKVKEADQSKKRGRPPKILQSDRDGELCCSVCNKVFKNARSFEKHAISHNKTREYTCHECGKQFKYRDNLKSHSMTHSGMKPFKCDMCEKTFSKKDNLQIHIRRHLKQREWSCEVCGSSYYTSYELKTHTRTHTGEKPHVCTLCGKRFTAKNNLYIHLRTHTGEKPHVCSVCGKQFTSKNILTIHSRTHSGEKPYICSVCGKRFTANKLAVHMRTHTGERPHVCSLCGKQFAAGNVLMIHMRRHTGEKPYECRICGQTYGHTQSLNKHMRKQHKIVTNVQQLKMKQINEAHQALLESRVNLVDSSKDNETRTSQSHTIIIKPLLVHPLPTNYSHNIVHPTNNWSLTDGWRGFKVTQDVEEPI